MQGRHAIKSHKAMASRKTPAHAGQTHDAPLLVSKHEEDPCACRADGLVVANWATDGGRPLRMQGRHVIGRLEWWVEGKTPAHAGQTDTPYLRL